MNTWEIQKIILDSAARYERDARRNVPELLKKNLPIAAGGLRSLAASLRGRPIDQATALLKKEHSLLEKRGEVLIYSALKLILWDIEHPS